MSPFSNSRLQIHGLGHYAFSIYPWALGAFLFIYLFSLVDALGGVAPGLFLWVLRTTLSKSLPYLPSVALLAGAGLHKFFHREEHPFWWNLGLNLPVRLAAAFVPLGLTAWGLSWISSWPF